MQRTMIVQLLLAFCFMTNAAGHTSLRLRAQPSFKAHSSLQEVTEDPANATKAQLAVISTSALGLDDDDDKDDDQDDDQDEAQVQIRAAPVKAPVSQKSQVHAPVQDHEEEDRRNAEKLGLHDIENSLAKLGGMGGKATPGMTKFVAVTKKMIKDDMKPKIMDAHRKDQQLLNSYKKGFGKCSKGRLTSRATFVALKKTRSSRSTSHKVCRKREAVYSKKKEQCDDLLDAKVEVEKAACNAVKDLTRNPNSEADNCHAARKEKFGEWLDRNELWFIAKNKEYKEAVRKCTAAKLAVKKLRPQCSRKTKLYIGKKAQCDVKQDQLEASACNLGKKMSQTCHGYRNCYADNKRAYRKAKPGIQKQEKDRKGEWRVLMRVECLLEVFAKDDGEVDAEVIGQCKNKTHDTTHLDLAYPTIPSLQPCKPIPPVPGQNSFKQAEYSSLPSAADAKIPSVCVVEAGTGIALGAPKGVPAAQCSMAGNYLKASSQGSCMLSKVDGTPIKVDYTKNMYTTYSFKMKFDGNPGNWNRMPVGGFKVCNVDRKSYRRGRSPEFNFYDIRGAWGYTFVRHPHTYARYQNRNDRNLGFKGRAYPKNGQEVHFEIIMRYASNRRLYVYSWKVNGVQLRAYNNYITNCWSHCRHDACTPRIWAWGSTKGVYIRDFRVYQGLQPMDQPQIVGTGIPRTRLSSACAKKGLKYSGATIPGMARVRESNVLNCQKRCQYLSGCAAWAQYDGTWCYFYAVGARASKTSRRVISGPPVCDSPYQAGLKAEFFFYNHQIRRLPNLLYAKPDMTRTDTVVWYYQTGGHWPGVKVHNQYASRWTGSILIKQPGNYRFDITSDDGSFLWIDGRVTVSNPGVHGPRTIYGWKRMSAGYHRVMLTHFENHGGSNMYFRYYGPDTFYHHTIVPSEVLRPANRDSHKTKLGPFGTPDDKRYYKFPDQKKLKRRGPLVYLLATVRAKNDAHIGMFAKSLKDPVSRSGEYYEFVIGGWGGARSRIRVRGKDLGASSTFPHTKNIISKYEYREFWISVNEKTGELAAGKGHVLGKYTFMTYKESKPMKMKAFAVMTGWGGTGEWYFVDKKIVDPKKKPGKFSVGGYFLGAQGEDCSKTCVEKGRTCDSNIRAGYSYNKFRMYIKMEMGATCQKDTRRWFGQDQPAFVSGGPDSNQGRCLGYSNVPTKVDCSAKHPRVMRWCKCSATTMVYHIKRQGKLQTWDQLEAAAKSRGGRLMTLEEARLYIHRRRFGVKFFRGQDVWAAVGDKDNKDWVQLGSPRMHYPGKSHVRHYRYPNWGNSVGRMRNYKRTTFNYLLWVSERKK